MLNVDNSGLPKDETGRAIERHLAGDPAAFRWIIETFTPPMLASARRRLSKRLRRYLDPEDLVQECWVRAINKLDDFRPGAEGHGPALLKLLSGIQANILRNEAKRWRSQTNKLGIRKEDLQDPLPADQSGVVTRAGRAESCVLVHDAIEALGPLHRDAIIMRGIEQRSVAQSAEIAGISEDALRARYRRARLKLKELLPNSFASALPTYDEESKVASHSETEPAGETR